LRGTTWSEIDVPAALWMRFGRPAWSQGATHRVPLSKPAVQLLRALPRGRDPERHIVPGSGDPYRTWASMLCCVEWSLRNRALLSAPSAIGCRSTRSTVAKSRRWAHVIGTRSKQPIE